MRLVSHRHLQLPGCRIAENFGEQQRVRLADIRSAPEKPLDVGEDLWILEGTGRALFHELAAETLANPPLQVRHERVDVDVSCQNCRAAPAGPLWSPSQGPPRDPSA